MKAFSTFLFFVSFLLVSSLLFGVYGCTPEKKQPQPVKPVQAEPAKPAPPANATGPVSVDFDRVPLADIALFMTQQTGQGFILNGAGDKPITWIEYNIPREKLFDAFSAALIAFDLILKPVNENRSVYTIDTLEEARVPYKLNFATGKHGTFFLFGTTIYSREKFPYPVRQDSGHWYAVIPKSLADQLNASEQTRNAKL